MRQQQSGLLEPQLVKSARAAMPSAWHMIRIDPRMVRFTQAECSPWFQRGGTLLELFLAILADDSDSLVETVPPLQIVWTGRFGPPWITGGSPSSRRSPSSRICRTSQPARFVLPRPSVGRSSTPAVSGRPSAKGAPFGCAGNGSPSAPHWLSVGGTDDCDPCVFQ